MKIIVDEEKQFKEIYLRNIDMVYRVCFIYFKGNKASVEDAVQSTFLQLLKKKMTFENEEHEKAWLIKVASNICKNMLKLKSNNNLSIEELDLEIKDTTKDTSYILDAVFSLPDKYKTVIYMHYYEGYSGVDTIYSYLSKGRSLLKDILKEDYYE